MTTPFKLPSGYAFSFALHANELSIFLIGGYYSRALIALSSTSYTYTRCTSAWAVPLAVEYSELFYYHTKIYMVTCYVFHFLGAAALGNTRMPPPWNTG